MSDMSDRPPAAVDLTADADLSGRRLGNYQLLRRLGRGGMAEVYLAEQVSLKRQVAFKVLKSSLATDDTYIKRFHVEAQAAASLMHAGIVQIYEVGCADGVHFIAQEYVQGQNLREYLVRHGPPDVRLAVQVMLQVAAALNRAAERGIVHRDIKPENIMLGRGGEVKVADFGLARLTRDHDAVNLTQVGVTMGTPLYMSPEQVEGKSLDHRSDIYSLGVTCYHMLAGAPPFRGETALSVAVQHLRGTPERLENVRPDLPPTLCRTVHKMLEKDPARRYQSARELVQDLRRLNLLSADDIEDDSIWESLGDLPTVRVAATQRLDTLMKTQSLTVTRRRRTWLFASLLLAAAFLGVAVALATRPASLLDAPIPAATGVERQPTARAQYLLASIFRTEEYWLAVLEFPENETYVRLAKQELALLYLRNNDLPAARRIFDEFANFESVEESFRAFGLAGQCIIESVEGRHENALRKLAELGPIRGRLDARMTELLSHAVQASLRALNRENDALWQEWQQGTFGDPPAAP